MKDNTCWICGSELPEQIAGKLGTLVAKLGLSERALNCLARKEIEYVEQLIKYSREEITRIRGLGKITFLEIQRKLLKIGFCFWEDEVT